MTSKSYRDNFALIDWSKPIHTPVKRQAAPRRSSLATPHVISDTMEPTQSMLDGQTYTSKRKLRETYKATPGIEEVGDDPWRLNTKKKAEPDKAEIRKAIEKAKVRVERGEKI